MRAKRQKRHAELCVVRVDVDVFDSSGRGARLRGGDLQPAGGTPRNDESQQAEGRAFRMLVVLHPCTGPKERSRQAGGVLLPPSRSRHS